MTACQQESWENQAASGRRIFEMNSKAPAGNPPGPQLWERITALSTAVFIVALVSFLLIRNEPFHDPNLAGLAKAILSLATALLGAVVPGFLTIKGKMLGMTIRAGGALALFVLTYFGSPTVLPNLDPGLDRFVAKINGLTNAIDRLSNLLESRLMTPQERQSVKNVLDEAVQLKKQWQSLSDQYADAKSKGVSFSAIIEKQKIQAKMAAVAQQIDNSSDNLAKVEKNLLSIPPPQTEWLEQATFDFVITNADHKYGIKAVVSATNAGANSIYVNIDSPPQPNMIWDIPLTAGFESRIVIWRGTTSTNPNVFKYPKAFPQAFNLTLGTHQLFLDGRGANVKLQSFEVFPIPSAPTKFEVIGVDQ